MIRQSVENRNLTPEPIRAFLVGFVHPGEEPGRAELMLHELQALTDTCGFIAVGRQSAKIRDYDPATILGSGKVQELIQEAERLHADVLVTDDVLTPAQQRNWESRAHLAVIDRQEVILEIFAARAQTREARLQVQLARANYELPRMIRKWRHLSRQRGASGGLGGRAGGEQQLELDSRVIRRKIQQYTEELAEVRKQRGVQRKCRLKKPVPVAAIVGYTNAGKSSLLNHLTQAGVLVENQLFATLDPTVRRMALPGGQDILLADTVGFVRKLPHLLIEAFKSTLEETALADYIIEVIDGADADFMEHHDTTLAVLKEIGAASHPSILVFNKWDLVDEEHRNILLQQYPDAIYVSAKTGEGVETLVAMLERRLKALMPVRRYIMPHHAYGELSQLRKVCFIENESFEDDGVHITARVPLNQTERWKQYQNPPHSVPV